MEILIILYSKQLIGNGRKHTKENIELGKNT